MVTSRRYLLTILIFLPLFSFSATKFDSYKGLVMAGYQGWFNTPTDGADRGWNHYQKKQLFEPGTCKIDMWPDMREYTNKYPTDFRYANGETAYVFSSYDESTIDLHFKWMKEYGIDGVFLQRFIVTLKSESGRNHSHKVLKSVLAAAKKYERVVAVMYDLSGMEADDYTILLDDWNSIIKEFGVNDRNKYSNYLFHNGKPLVAVWGVGFNDKRKYGLDAANKIVNSLKDNKNSVLLGVPTYWRTLTNDTESDSQLHTLLQNIDILHPWFVGRFDEERYDTFLPHIEEDVMWCKKHGIDYVPTVFPGFSWYNMKTGSKINQIPRNKGNFYWKQFAGAIQSGAEMIYVAMFDEIDEATAIFKCVHEAPIGESKFVTIDNELDTDHYLWLTGQAKLMLNKKLPFSWQQPSINLKN